MHQVLEFEEVMESGKDRLSPAVSQWLNKVINAAYADNEVLFGELIAQVG